VITILSQLKNVVFNSELMENVQNVKKDYSLIMELVNKLQLLVVYKNKDQPAVIVLMDTF
jgi:hypothetical protein